MTRREFHVTAMGCATAAAQTKTSDDRRIAPVAPPDAGKLPGIGAGIGGGARKALVLGNNAYTHAPLLKNAVNDSEAMSKTLKSFQFDVQRADNFGLAAGKKAVDYFVSSLKDGDVGLLFYSGHGVQIGGENYLVPVDFNPGGGEARVRSGCVSIPETQARIEKTGARMNILVIDACRDNPFRTDKVKGLALMEAGLGTCLALSAAPGQTASDNSAGKNGLFTQFLLRELASPPQPLEALFKNVKERVYEASGQKQRPWLFFDTIGDFLFTTADVAAVPKSDGFQRMLEQGKIAFQAGRLEEAGRSFESAIRVNPEDPYCYNALGAVRLRTKQVSAAIGYFGTAIEKKPDYGAAYFNRGLAYYNAAKYELAVQDFSWAIESDPGDPRALDLRGQAYYALGRSKYDEALGDFNSALNLNPSDATALLGRGRIGFRTGDNARALEDLSACLAIRKGWEGLDLRAQVYRAMGRSQEEASDRQQAESLRPK